MNSSTSACLLRGINVSGKNMIRMDDLAGLFRGLGFENVSTYLQSGNVIFSHGGQMPAQQIATIIFSAISEEMGLEVPVIIRSRQEISNILINNPFINRDNLGMDRLYVTMAQFTPSEKHLSDLSSLSFTPERIEIQGKDIYFYSPDGYGRAKLNNNYLEKKAGVTCTTRNWKTIMALGSMMNDA
ncbi:MAG TPA: DUF1697 domain-containing protein [Bacteroidales bacterium]|nr:DUF1697 domain-containing protein [Bacteroidales bacterium]